MKKIIFIGIIFLRLSVEAQTWSAVGTGTDQPVSCSAVYNGELYVCGQFDSAGGNFTKNIAKWNGISWSGVGGGMPGLSDRVYDLEVYNGNLYAAGWFYNAGGTPVNNVASWNGSIWLDVGFGTSGGQGSYVSALCVFYVVFQIF